MPIVARVRAYVGFDNESAYEFFRLALHAQGIEPAHLTEPNDKVRAQIEVEPDYVPGRSWAVAFSRSRLAELQAKFDAAC